MNLFPSGSGQRFPRLRCLAAGLCLTLGACGSDRVSDGATSIQELLRADEALVGEESEATGVVAQVISDRMWRVGARGAGEGPGLLVVSEEEHDLTPAEKVRITGTLEPWDVHDLGIYLNENVNLELYNELEEDELVFVADDIDSVAG